MLFSLLGNDASCSQGWAATLQRWLPSAPDGLSTGERLQQRSFRGGRRNPSQHCPPARALPSPPCPSIMMFVMLAGSELSLGTGTTQAPSALTPTDDLFLVPAFVQTLAAELVVDTLFEPILRGDAAAALGKLVDRLCTPIVDRAHWPKGGLSCCVAGSCTAAGRARQTDSAFPPAAGCARRYFVSATMAS